MFDGGGLISIMKKTSKTFLEEIDFLDLDEDDFEEYNKASSKKKTSPKRQVSQKRKVSQKKKISRKKSSLKSKKRPISRNRRHNGKESGLWYKIKHMDTIDRVVTSTGALIMVFAIVTCTLYANAKVLDKQVVSFEEIGTQMEGIEIGRAHV